MTHRQTAREREGAAAASGAPSARVSAEAGEAMSMLVRRGFSPRPTSLDVPFSADIDEQVATRLSALLDHYGFRLFLRGAILRADDFAPEETTQYLLPQQARAHAESLVTLGLVAPCAPGRYRLLSRARSFGGTLEWYVARELRRRLGLDVASGIKLRAKGVGGDLDVVASGEGKLIYLELKSSPPKHLRAAEVVAFFDRLQVLRPDISLFVMDTALRLVDKVVPMLLAELHRRLKGAPIEPRRVGRELWALTPHLYAANGKPDLIRNISRAITEGLQALWVGL